ncbi:C2 family cysteine protease [Herbiconiux sp. UC225_62]|uniref:C2 family cysteine protease n=1 Tax=Herbiconiux sp. UC225_62 TaxID=3350168 RepID=UPI0036D31FD0
MGSFFGADVAELRAFAKLADSSGEQLDHTVSTLSGLIGQAAWHGPDGSEFSGLWNAKLRVSLQQASSGLKQVATTVRANADQQEASSTDDGAYGGGSGAGAGGSDSGGKGGKGDKPDNPDAPDDMGPYQDLDDPIPLDDPALDPTNMAQGQLGDCWFLAAAGAVAAADPEWIRDHMWQNPDGTWTVKMYKDGEPVYIQVEPTVPENSVKDADGDDNWLSVYEKAAAEYFGGDYEDIDGGWPDDAFEAITGQKSEDLGESNLDDIRDSLNDGPVSVTTEGDDAFWWWQDEVDDKGIVPNHAYIVDTVENHVNPDTGKEEQMIHLLNPWGPNGGTLDGEQKYGDVWLTEDEYKDNFDHAFSGSTK